MDEDIGIPDVKPDIVIKSNGNFLIFLSLKTSLRERWKQADWEAIKFKEKFKDGICYLLSNNEKEVTNIKKKDNEINIFFDADTFNLIGWQNTDIYQNFNITFFSSIKKNEFISKNLFKLPSQN